MIDSEILAASQRQSELEAAKAAFFASGGQAVVVDSFRLAPRPLRKDVSVERSQRIAPRRKPDQAIDAAAKRRAHVERIRQLAATMCYREAIAETGMSHSALYLAARDGDFKFQPDPTVKLFGGVKDHNPERDGKLCERFAALRDAGLSRKKACKHIGVSPGVLSRLIAQYDFSYPAHTA